MSYPPRFGVPHLTPAAFVQAYGHVPVVPVLPAGAHYIVPSLSAPTVVNAQPAKPAAMAPLTPQMAKRQELMMERPPVTTVFVGNINERVSNEMIKAMLTKCGNILNWKRVQGPSGKFQAFGFCEYDHPDSTLRALRLLHDWPLGEKKLVLKCDEKNKATLIDFINKRRELYNKPPLKIEGDQMPADEEMKKEDEEFRKALVQLVEEMAGDLASADSVNGSFGSKSPTLAGKGGNLDIESLDRDRKEYIAKEIIQFREAHKDEKETRTKDKDEQAGQSPGGGGATAAAADKSAKRHRSASRHSARSNSVDSKQSSKKTRIRDSSRDSASDRRRPRLPDADDDDSYERRRIERRIREKEAAYQVRLEKWESRERRKAREYEKKRETEMQRGREESRELKLLKEFLEDYDDDRMDANFYRGRALETRLRDYKAETERDDRDRERERQELEKLKKELAKEKAAQERREMEKAPGWKPVFVNNEVDTEKPGSSIAVDAVDYDKTSPSSVTTKTRGSPTAAGSHAGQKVISFSGLKLGGAGGTASTVQPTAAAALPDLFADEEAQEKPPARKLVPLDYTDEEKQAIVEAPYEHVQLTPEEKRRIIRSLIEKIPTNKEELFAHKIQWEFVDKYIIEKRLRPWVIKKVVEYIGEEELSLVDFICQKVMQKSAPQEIINDISVVLDEEATVFVVKMWRLLIYEIEAKKAGVSGKTESQQQ